MEKVLVDVMLMRLGRWLRLLGLDVANPPGEKDSDLLQLARLEDRTLLTRDRRLAEMCRSAGLPCLLIQSSLLEDQLQELAGLGLALELNPQRCTLCNGPLAPASEDRISREPISKDSISGKYISREPTSREQVSREQVSRKPISEGLWRCESCGHLYWEGSHWRRMEETLRKIRRRES
jgi:uncharacterized protein with PIN domain